MKKCDKDFIAEKMTFTFTLTIVVDLTKDWGRVL